MFGSKLDILNKQWIDVVFAGRNKAYGAYELRRENPRNTNKALIIGVAAFVLLISFKTILNAIEGFIPKADEKVKVTEVLLPPPPVNEAVKTPPPPPEPPKPKVDQVRFPPPVVKPDNEVREKDPPTVEELKVADPGQKDQKGDPNQAITIDEPVGNSDVKQVVEENPNQIFAAVEQAPAFPGGESKFYKYLQDNVRYPSIARENNVQGRVILTFVVEKDGSLTDIKVVRGIGSGCDEEAIRVLKRSPRWKPGIQNGRPVRVQYSIPVNFTLASE
ncbi:MULTISPECIES: TonB family protein [unclassified Mucilaginibacter]|uniref:energy transducer TonB n=2 Tax=Mucilaginibacter TaxID=423349 RepID=UPI002AC895C5|nr:MULTISPECIES: TonB family protein [unclassified Mucilaginibacter]MEB0263969.1 TonB family protein [Mucilaginibacter sp. 10I4]MEB0279829.1 TonB family protein [Mucilaginibacter sp. 10B2]WPX24199.1 TonB family protein [Mucilaginibacter sp. 5C4]